MSSASYETPHGPVEVHFRFSRKGDCQACGGTGLIERYRYTNGGRCWTCRGTGGKKPPKGAYKAYRCPGPQDIFYGDDPHELHYLGVIAPTKKGWQTASGDIYPSLTAAALALYLEKP